MLHTACASNCLTCAVGAGKCDVNKCASGYTYVAASQTCARTVIK